MLIFEIIKYPDPILRKKCQEIKKINQEIINLVLKMTKIMKENQGIGLAASQIGILKRVIVIQTEKGPEAFINPQIIKKSEEKEVNQEGCLSFPNLFLKIKRAREVELKAIDIEKKIIQIKAKGLLAQVFQHEIDHLDGILFIDHIRAEQRMWELFKFYIRSRK